MAETERDYSAWWVVKACRVATAVLGLLLLGVIFGTDGGQWSLLVGPWSLAFTIGFGLPFFQWFDRREASTQR